MLEKILDENSLAEYGSLLEGAGVTTGCAAVDGRLVYAYEQTGDVTAAHAKKIGGLYKKALKSGAPVIGVLNSGGTRLDGGLDALAAYGEIFREQAEAKGRIAQIAVVSGDCMGLCSLIAANSDFIVADKKSRLFLQSPNVAPEKASALYAHVVAEDAAAEARRLFSFIPGNADSAEHFGEAPPDLNRDAVFGKDSTAAEIAGEIADGRGITLRARGAVHMSLERVGGMTVGAVGFDAAADADGLRECARFVRFCDSFRLPLLFIYEKGAYARDCPDTEMLLRLSDFANSVRRAEALKIALVTGGASAPLYSAALAGAVDFSFAWGGASFALMPEEGAKKLTGGSASFTAEEAAKIGFIDCVIEPAASRKRIIAALEAGFLKNFR
ncbi:MAG: hypothetical protein LBU36_00130 [Clostridiales bacterium]|jgi:acetyl-CoA carboxylase carboxyltransferase component|nr:hypothetical protein [Clostridiales bacterium]